MILRILKAKDIDIKFTYIAYGKQKFLRIKYVNVDGKVLRLKYI